MERINRMSGRTRENFAPILFILYILLISCSTIEAQTVAILTSDKKPLSIHFAREFESKLADRLKVLDDGLAETAYRSVSPPTPFNLSTGDAKKIGAVIGCDAFIILRAETQRRSSFERNTYYETYAPVYVVSSRTGRLVFWQLQKFNGDSAAKSERSMDDSAGHLAAEVAAKIKAAINQELAEPDRPVIEEVPNDKSPEAANFRAPVPYRRIKPDYTAEAAAYDIAATVEIEVDLDATGTITRTEIVRWAGYGLDESVEKTVRQMNWRPAERDGKTLPMRFLLRYNFKKI